MDNKDAFESDEITLRELLSIISVYVKEVLKNKTILLLVILLGGLIMFFQTFKTPITYTADVEFMLNDDGDSGGAGLGDLAASLGFGITRRDYNLDKIMKLLKSRNIIQRILFKTYDKEGKVDFVANHLIDIYELNEQWEKDELLNGFRFTNSSVNSFNRKENKALKVIYRLIVGDEGGEGIMSSRIDELTGIMNIYVTSLNENLSIDLAKMTYNELSYFYVDKTTEKQQEIYNILKVKTDSLLNELDKKQYSLLKFKDSQRNLSLKQYELKEMQLQRDVQLLATAYSVSVKNLETADFSLKSQTPFVQTIDLPIPPLQPSISFFTFLKNIIIGCVVGGIFGVVFICGRKIIKDVIGE